MKSQTTEKFYPNLIRAVVASMQLIFAEGQYADKVIERALKSNRQWGSRDRAFIAENVYDMVRWYRMLYEIDGREPRKEADWWRLFGILQLVRGGVLPEWSEFRQLNPKEVEKKRLNLLDVRKIRESVPDWLDALGEAELGPLWEPTLHALNQPARVVLRANSLKTNSVQLQERLREEDIIVKPMDGDALLVTERRNLFTTRAFREGLFEVQDFSSQQVAPFLEVAPGMRVVDACAGAGGKSLHLATLMQNRGQIIALDTEAWKLEELRRRARRNGVHIIETRPVDTAKVIKRLHGKADRLLMDVPCSGLGVLRRNPDAKWKLSPEFLDRVRQTQAGILEQYASMLKPGGKMVYATCSILPSENRRQVDHFMERQDQHFTFIKERIILPQEEGFDGFYMALLERKG